MATATQRALRRAEHSGEAISENLAQQIAVLRKQVDEMSRSVQSYGGHSIDDLQHNAVALAHEVREQGRVVARQVGRQANIAGKAVQENPVPVLVVLGTIALLSTLLFTRD
jgi:ElaB/YqjD/DUF883 family membrane-anchored ribosome-binding protein